MLNTEANEAAREAILKFIDGKTSVVNAVDLLLSAARTQNGKDVDGDKAWTSSLEIFKIAYDAPSGGDEVLKKLVEFVIDLKRRPEAQEPTVGKNGVTTTFWGNLTMTSREMWNLESDLTAGQWRSLHAFFALLWAKGAMNGALWPIWCLRSELEEVPEKEQDLKVYASQAYIQYAGHLIFQSREVWDFNTPGNPKSGNRAQVGSLLREQKDIPFGYSAARWACWKQRFEQIMELNNTSEPTRQTARKALSEMNDIEATG